jgi:hypothetical protein
VSNANNGNNNVENNGWGCTPVFLGVILLAGIVALCVFGIVPAIDRWQAGNTQVAAIAAQRDAQVAQMEAQARLQIAQLQAQRDVQIAQMETQAQVQSAAIALAGDAMRESAATSRLLLWFVFAIGVGGGVTFAAYKFDWRV